MNIFEYIILAVITILALLFIVHTIVKIVKGESPCLFCKSCDEDEKKSSCDVSKENKSSCPICDKDDNK